MKRLYLIFIALSASTCIAIQPTTENPAVTCQKAQRAVAHRMWRYSTAPDSTRVNEIVTSEIETAIAESAPEIYAQKLVQEWQRADETGKKIIEERIQRLMHTTSPSEKQSYFYKAFYGDIADAKLKRMQTR